MAIRKFLLISTALLVLSITAAISSAPASAASASFGIDHNGGAPDINAGPAQVVEGGDVTVGLISNAGAPGLGAWTINVAFDTSVLDATSCATNPAYSQACNPHHALGVRLSGAELAGVTGTVDLMEITFHALGAKGSCSALRVDPELVTDPDANAIASSATNGQICIVGCADVTRDGRVGLADGVLLVLRILLRRPYLATYDLNGDGKVDAGDYLVWRKQFGSSC